MPLSNFFFEVKSLSALSAFVLTFIPAVTVALQPTDKQKRCGQRCKAPSSSVAAKRPRSERSRPLEQLSRTVRGHVYLILFIVNYTEGGGLRRQISRRVETQETSAPPGPGSNPLSQTGRFHNHTAESLAGCVSVVVAGVY